MTMTDFFLQYKPELTKLQKEVRVDVNDLVTRGVSSTPEDILRHMTQAYPGIYFTLCEGQGDDRKEILHAFRDSDKIEIFAPDDLNHYHDYIFEKGLEPNKDRERIIRKACNGELRRWEFEAWNSSVLDFSFGRYRDRRYYTMNCSWAIYTAEWIDDIARIVQDKRVVEVCAGRGILGPIMQKRAIDWFCTDAKPPRGVTHVKKLDAVEAVKVLKPDIVFASWIPYKSTELDYEIACMGIPMIIVGEGWGGCTGSKKFWGEYIWIDDEEQKDDGVPRPYEVIEVHSTYENFNDVPQWDGLHDYTSFVIPEGRKPEEFFSL